jgi:DNA-binding LytR/AlgR family response regulator
MFLMLRKMNESGQEAGFLLVNVEAIVSITASQHATELRLVNGDTKWVRETLLELKELVKG